MVSPPSGPRSWGTSGTPRLPAVLRCRPLSSVPSWTKRRPTSVSLRPLFFWIWRNFMIASPGCSSAGALCS
eukprot:1282834-Pyramimonas_sp.AAC.1